MGKPIENTGQKQELAKVQVYPGANGESILYDDDGTTYAFEKGESRITQLHWDDATGRLTHEGAQAWMGPDGEVVDIVKR